MDGVRYEVTDRVAVITIDRPEARNAIDADVFRGVGDLARRAGSDAGVGAVLVRGEGGHFSSGIDVRLFGDQLVGGVEESFIRWMQASFDAFEDLDKPTVAAIEGHCLGAGLQLALACHLRAVAPSASLAVLEVVWGLVPDLGGTFRLPRLVGLGRATELVASGRRVGADEALAIGLADVRLGDEPAQEAHELAVRLAAGPGAVRRAIRLLRENLGRDREAAEVAEAGAQLACLAGPDFAEAVSARVEGRDPTFVGE